MTVVEELVSVLGLEIGDSALSNLSKFRAAVTQGLAGVGGIVAALGAAFAGTVVSVANLGIEIDTTSRKLGVSTAALQEYRYAADVTNVSFDSLTTAIKFLSKNAAEGGDASKRILEGFSGIAMRDAKGNLKTAEVLFEDLADKIAATKDPIKQVELAMHALHGQSGTEVLPLLKLGKKGIQDLREEAEALGYVLDKKTIDSSKRFHVSLTRLKYALMGVRNEAGAPFIDDFSDALDWMTERVRRARVWVQGFTKDIRDLGQRFGRMMEVGKKAFEAIGKFVEDNRLDKISDSIRWLDLLKAALIGIAVIAAVSAAAFAASWILAAAPFIIIATLIGLIVDDIAHFLSGGKSVLGMADEWSKAFDLEDSNLIKFFKEALRLLFDLGDPAKWQRVRDAAKDLITGKTQAERDAAMGVKAAPNGQLEMSEEEAFPDLGHRALRAVGIHNNQKHFMPIKKWQDTQQKPSKFDADYLRSTLPSSLGGQPTGDDLAAHLKATLPRSMGGDYNQTVHINVNGAGDPAKVADEVMKKIHDEASDAKAAITGGS